jgi:hypothetical protein
MKTDWVHNSDGLIRNSHGMPTELWWGNIFEKGNFDDQAIPGKKIPG